ncbi:MAG: membrane protein insertase YidC [Treponema sp.]|jgi:YidC/Oxa1 family membrane protein insertase|nr:membrane protein insertase YidC [Treponema sp.]
MEKRTLLAVVLSISVMLVFYFIQSLVSPPPPLEGEGAVSTAPYSPVEVSPGSAEAPGVLPPASGDTGQPAAPEAAIPGEVPLREERIVIDTARFRAELTSAGGDMVSWKLKEHNDTDGYLEMIMSGESEARAFSVAFGNMDAKPVNNLFNVKRVSEYTVEFYQDFVIPQNGSQEGRFRLTKRYNFKPGEYMFELVVILDGGYAVSGFSFPGNSGGTNAAYTLGFGPQIGPRFEKLDQRYEYRNYFTFTSGKRKQEKVNDNNPAVLNNSRAAWSAIAGKYFTLVAIPLLSQYDLAFSSRGEPGLAAASRLFITRPAFNTSRTEDVYRFYLGPKTQEVLMAYNTGANEFNLRDMQLVEVANTKGFLSPLENILKVLLTFFNSIVHNYGVAIILLTLVVRALLFPLTKKGSEATLRMQALAPRIKEIQEKHKDNPQKMNAEMAEFYKKEGYNPLSGCLPMLLQIPIFFAMYNLFNNHFDLRGAMFIPGWIPDLSLPESVFHFENFQFPFLGWTDIRLLPFIYVGSQLLYGKVTQTPDQQSNAQMKMMLYVMPIVFFFILYDVPSGLLLYWIMSNVLTMGQQLVINKYLAKRRAAMAAAAGNKPPVIIPKKKRK